MRARTPLWDVGEKGSPSRLPYHGFGVFDVDSGRDSNNVKMRDTILVLCLVFNSIVDSAMATARMGQECPCFSSQLRLGTVVIVKHSGTALEEIGG